MPREIGRDKKEGRYIRRIQQDRLVRKDLDELLAFQSNDYFNGISSVGFIKRLEKNNHSWKQRSQISF
ncbi:hypothetical protein ABR763_13500 [Bacillus cereus]|uniref:Uncharacterized protein n=1 Tax=Bacillus paranthracis TaxID=2026186 RepID=A0AAJ1NIX8_9BACI|nr:hypothetical protein [Bacillus paranthracis]MDG0947899.1 hypothetical protein [Bacillus paranthracis]MDG0954079.1 hypothetical protein [Bacillus paranthracis]TBL17206.1 hypothetical protein EYB35_04860 [Bacillus paranthracis]HDR7274218.1 hypothetical protein [Bacillus paranthracis]HDR7305658.1 hypothetical protein [Bacillus paranthracis]